MKTKNSKVASLTISGNKKLKPIVKKDTNPAIDKEFLREMTGDDKDFKNEILVLFLNSSQNDIAKMDKALVDKDDTNWYLAAHHFKGSSSSIGAFILSGMAEYAQTHSKENIEKKEKLLADLKIEMERVVEVINQELSK